MEETLASRNVTTEFVEVSDNTVYIGYRSNETDMANLFTELQVVVQIVLGHEPGAKVMGAIFHTEHPVVGTWRVDATWAEQREDDALSETALAAHVLHTLQTVRF